MLEVQASLHHPVREGPAVREPDPDLVAEVDGAEVVQRTAALGAGVAVTDENRGSRGSAGRGAVLVPPDVVGVVRDGDGPVGGDADGLDGAATSMLAMVKLVDVGGGVTVPALPVMSAW